MKLALIALSLFASGAALAQSTPQPQPTGRPVPAEVRQGMRHDANAFNKQTFEERKADILKRQDERAQRLKKETDCVKAAATPDALKTCHEETQARHMEMRREMREHFAEHGPLGKPMPPAEPMHKQAPDKK